MYHSGQAPYGCHSHSPARPAIAAQTQAAGSTHGTRSGSAGPRSSAAASNTRAMAVPARATCHVSHNPTLTPIAGGAMPRPR